MLTNTFSPGNMEEDVAARERKWQERWLAAGIGRAQCAPGKPKYYIIFAYPGSSGFIHLGHMRGYSYSDALARYHRMKGEQVFFPGGTHASGLPAISFAAKVAKGDADTLDTLRSLGLDAGAIKELTEPEAAARFLGETYWQTWERFGLIMDRSAYVTTIDPDYQQFIRWQFQRLEQDGYLIQKPYYAPFCPRSGPVSVDPSETDLSRGGNAEVVTYTALPFRLPDGRKLLAATLRPETVYGATNVWLPRDVPLVEWKFQGTTYIVGEAGSKKLIDQQGGTLGLTVQVSSIVGQKVKAPLTGEELPLIISPLVDVNQGTGVVMSVPGHAPADWVALSELPSSISEPLLKAARVIVDIPETGLAASEKELLRGKGAPAARAVANIGVKGLADAEKLQEATERVYRLEFGHGILTAGPFAGQTVPKARESVSKEVIAKEGAVELREFSEPVICRCGETVVIHRIPDQWFLAYGSKEWKERTLAQTKLMEFQPPEYGQELVQIMDWFDDRPAVRKGKWLGTPFPKDPRWIIEPIADSTLYPAYYVVRRFVTGGVLAPEQLTPSLFDYVFLGEGKGEPSVPRELQEEIRKEFLYWYPLDLNVGGKEHKRVHFPVFIYNHVAIFPAQARPKGIFVYWWLTNYGEKLSKKDIKGGAVPTVEGALTKWGADAMRLYYALSASASQDVEWSESTCEAARQRIDEVARMILSLPREAGPASVTLKLETHIDQWLAIKVHEVVVDARKAFEKCDVRGAAQRIYVDLPTIIRRYKVRGGSNDALLARTAGYWARMLVPVTPHIAEEINEQMNKGTALASSLTFPSGEELSETPASLKSPTLERERVIEGVEEDVASLVKIWKTAPTHLTVFVSADWKYTAEAILREMLHGKASVDIGKFVQRARENPDLAPHLKDLARYASEVKGAGIEGLPPFLTQAEETKVIREAVPYLARRFELKKVDVWTEEEGSFRDPANRRSRARPGRPALSIE
jgi:leucyl-tRNA synthetase